MKKDIGRFQQYHGRYEFLDALARWFFRVGGVIVLGILLLIFVYLVKNSFQFLSRIGIEDFIFSSHWFPTSLIKPEYGILSMLVGTIYVTVGATVFSGFVGITSAIFLSEYLSPRLRNIIRYVVEIFASIPSVVIGLIGISIIGPFFMNLFGWSSIFNAYMTSFLVGIMALPTVMSISLDILERFPQTIKIASMGLGASKWETVYKVILPGIQSGLFTALMLGMGRSVGETMIVLMVGGNSLGIPTSFKDPVRTLTSNIAIEMGEVSHLSLHYSSLFTIGLILFIFTFMINYLVDRVSGQKNIL